MTQLVFEEEFENNGNGWLILGDKAYIQHGKYYLNFASDHEVWSSIPLGLNDFTLEVEIGPGDNTHAYGLVFGDKNEARYYIFNLHGRDFSFQKVDKGQWENLTWKTSGAIRGGEALNSLKVIRQEGKFKLFINGQEVGTFPVELEVASEIGIYAGGGDEIMVESLKAWASQDWVKPLPTPTPTPEATPVPVPTEVPGPPVCEVPHWIDRTPDRKTGITFSDGTPVRIVYHPDTSPWAPYNNGAREHRVLGRVIGYDLLWDREAQIVSVDRERQIIQFYVGRGLNIQRRFTGDTYVIMEVHEKYRGMKLTDVFQVGGNFCDLEVGDLVAILHPDFGEAASPNPELVDLWGVLIVQ